MNCDNCKWYSWYYDRCEKWKCEIDAREIHNCFEPTETPILNAMVYGIKVTQKGNFASQSEAIVK